MADCQKQWRTHTNLTHPCTDTIMSISSSSTYFYSFEVLDDARYIPLVVIGSITSFLSLLGSGCVLFMSSREASKSVMQRIMFALSLADFISSTSNLLMPYLIPSSLGLPGASGNHASCAASGFFLMTFILVGCCYNAYLSGYFYLVVCHNWKERDFVWRQETLCHLFAFGVPMAINLAAVALQSINPSPLLNNVCTIATWPWTCNENGQLECTRSSEQATTIIVVSSGIFLFFFTIMGFVCTGLVWNSVRKTFARSSHYRFDHNSGRTDERILQVRTQAILYSLVYFNTFFWPFVGMVLSNDNVHTSDEIQEKKLQTGVYIFQILYWAFYPLQGALNFFVYTRLRVQRRRREDPTRSWWGVYKQVILTSSSSAIHPSKSSAATSHNAAVQRSTPLTHHQTIQPSEPLHQNNTPSEQLQPPQRPPMPEVESFYTDSLPVKGEHSLPVEGLQFEN